MSALWGGVVQSYFPASGGVWKGEKFSARQQTASVYRGKLHASCM